MTFKLVIVESPAKCRKIEEYLGSGYKVMASFGHIRKLNKRKGLGCIDISNNFTPEFIIEDKAKQVKLLRSAVKKATEVIIATDDDREGEAIGWHLCIVLGLQINKTKRIIFNAITKDAIQRAIQNPTTLCMPKINAQLARSVLDFLIGYSISPILWKRIKKGLSAGRCQTPALRLVYDKTKEIKETKGYFVYDIFGEFQRKEGKGKEGEGKQGKEKEGKKETHKFELDTNYSTKEEVIEFLEICKNKKEWILKSRKPKIKVKKSPKPLITSTIQQRISSLYGYSPKDTMSICQVLYENGFITYMRTDNPNFSGEFLNKAKEHISERYGDDYFEYKQTKGSKNAQEAHEAIRPTNLKVERLPQKFNERQRKVYEFIYRHSLECCMIDAQMWNYVWYLEISDKEDEATNEPTNENEYFEYSLEIPKVYGWLIVENKNYEKEKILKKEMEENEGCCMAYTSIESVGKIIGKKSNYNEASLVNMLEKKGIGRPSTFSSLVSKIQERQYVRKGDIESKTTQIEEPYMRSNNEIKVKTTSKKLGNEKNKLILEKIGERVIELLIANYDDLFNYDFTKRMEDKLDKIAQNELVWYKVVDEMYQELQKRNLEVSKKELKNEWQLKEDVYLKLGPYGYYVEEKKTDGSLKRSPCNDDMVLDDLLREGKKDIQSILKLKEVSLLNGEKVVIYEGKFGPYFKYKNENYSIEKKLVYDKQDIVNAIQAKKEKASVEEIRISDKFVIRNGKFGYYCMEKADNKSVNKTTKTTKSKKPKFYSLKGCPIEVNQENKDELLRWLNEKYKLDM